MSVCFLFGPLALALSGFGFFLGALALLLGGFCFRLGPLALALFGLGCFGLGCFGLTSGFSLLLGAALSFRLGPALRFLRLG